MSRFSIIFCLAGTVFLLYACKDASPPMLTSPKNKLVVNAMIDNKVWLPYLPITPQRRVRFRRELMLAKTPFRVVADDALGIKMELFNFSLGLSDEPILPIIYWDIGDSLQFAFSFTDELQRLIGSEESKGVISSKTQLEFQLNFMAEMAGINQSADSSEMLRLCELLFKSLLSCHRIRLDEIEAIKDEWRDSFFLLSEKKKTSCESEWENYVTRMESEIKEGKVMFFTAHQGLNAFWRVEVVDDVAAGGGKAFQDFIGEHMLLYIRRTLILLPALYSILPASRAYFPKPLPQPNISRQSIEYLS